VKALKIQDRLAVRGGLLLRFALAVSLAAGLSLATGCKPHAAADASADQSAEVSPEVAANLAQLTRELRRTMPGHRLSGSFEEFASVRSDLAIPPPPPGKKYAINKKWKVVLEDL
jgi:hypothetical protein